MSTHGVIDIDSGEASLEVSECTRTSDTYASYVLSVAAHLEVLEKRGVDDGETVETHQPLYFIPTQTAPVPPTTGPRELSRTMTSLVFTKEAARRCRQNG